MAGVFVCIQHIRKWFSVDCSLFGLVAAPWTWCVIPHKRTVCTIFIHSIFIVDYIVFVVLFICFRRFGSRAVLENNSSFVLEKLEQTVFEWNITNMSGIRILNFILSLAVCVCVWCADLRIFRRVVVVIRCDGGRVCVCVCVYAFCWHLFCFCSRIHDDDARLTITSNIILRCVRVPLIASYFYI